MLDAVAYREQCNTQNGITLINGDCLEAMKGIDAGSIDMILTDPPYGTIKYFDYNGRENVNHGWDTMLDTSKMFNGCDRVLRKGGALALFCQDPYTSELSTSYIPNLPFSYRMTWLKDHFANALIAKKAPVNHTEDICLFFKKHDRELKHPLRDYAKSVLSHCFKDKAKKEIFEEMGHQGICHFMRTDTDQFSICTEKTYSELIEKYGIDKMPGYLSFDLIKSIDSKYAPKVFNLQPGKKYKSNVLEYKKDYSGHHPTQKPVALLIDLIETYTRPGDTVLDFTMGSGSTGVACIKTGRKFIGIELDEKFYKVSQERINKEINKLC